MGQGEPLRCLRRETPQGPTSAPVHTEAIVLPPPPLGLPLKMRRVSGIDTWQQTMETAVPAPSLPFPTIRGHI